MRIRHGLHKVDGAYQLADVKTVQSRCLLRLSDEILADLQTWRAQQRRERLALGPDWADTLGPVFTRPDGRPLDGTATTKHPRKLLAKDGLSRQRFHDLRHHAATLMLAQGADPGTSMANLGHSAIATTANVYARVTQETQRAAARRMGALLALRDTQEAAR